MAAIHVSDDQFEELVLKSDVPVLVDFYAEWCGPCKMASPILDKLADEHTDVKIVKIDVDKSELAPKYGVMSIPTVIGFKAGEVAKANGKDVRQTGFTGAQMYEDMIKSLTA